MLKVKSLVCAVLSLTATAVCFAEPPVELASASPAVVRPATVHGTWILYANGKPSPVNRVTFNRDNTFRFQGGDFSSEGIWSISEGVLWVEYRKIDGQAVEPGTMRRKFVVDPVLMTIRVDRFEYRPRPAE